MSQRNRIVIAAIALVAALFLAAPTPARAASLSEGRLPLAGAWERAWSWLAELVFPGGGAPARPTARWEKEGSAINPDGRTTPSTSAPAPPLATADEGSAINPDGVKWPPVGSSSPSPSSLPWALGRGAEHRR
ncbi:MAG: hypothetical protein QOF89_738 [Acidobacteriota bacterium]|jgi:hypothetical protein|nr:hypothetical protein [Acidobacteriota bacterium]